MAMNVNPLLTSIGGNGPTLLNTVPASNYVTSANFPATDSTYSDQNMAAATFTIPAAASSQIDTTLQPFIASTLAVLGQAPVMPRLSVTTASTTVTSTSMKTIETPRDALPAR